MKKKILVLCSLVLLLFSTTIIAQNRVVDQPAYESSNTRLFEINKLELKDSVTILYCNAYNTPGYWIQISSQTYLKGKSGQKYKLLHSEGFELDKKVAMPQSGYISFKLFMEPLGKGEKSFDFMEGEYSGAFKIKGIRTFKLPPSASAIHCILKGKVIGRPKSVALLFTKAFEDARSASAIRIPIVDGSFSHKLNYTGDDAYELVFEDEYYAGSWRSINFFSHNGEVNFELHSMDNADNNKIIGGELNKLYSEYLDYKTNYYNTHLKSISDSIESLFKSGGYYNEEANRISDLASKTKDRVQKDKLYGKLYELQVNGLAKSKEAKRLDSLSQVKGKNLTLHEYNYLNENRTIVSYFMLLKRIRFFKQIKDYKEKSVMMGEMLNKSELERLNNAHSEMFSNHRLSKLAHNIFWTLSNYKIGEKTIDFTLKDMTGIEFNLSKQIKDKYAIIDVWAPWCGSCIRSMRNMKPVYEEFKDKGFTVVSVASKYKDISAVEKILNKDQYPWITLIDKPEDNSGINQKLGIESAGGTSYLVDKEGKILAINPSAEDVRDILQKNLN